MTWYSMCMDREYEAQGLSTRVLQHKDVERRNSKGDSKNGQKDRKKNVTLMIWKPYVENISRREWSIVSHAVEKCLIDVEEIAFLGTHY